MSAGDKGYVRRGDLRLELEGGERRDGVEILFDLGLSIGGALLDAGGRPLPNIAVGLYRGDLDPTEPGRRRLTYNLSGADGRFVLRGLEPGTYDLDVSAQSTLDAEGSELVVGRSRWKGIDAGTTDLRLVVGRGTHVEGRIVGPGGEPASGCCVFAVVDGENQGNYIADGEGRFRIPCPEGRPADLVAWPSAGPPGSTQLIVDGNGAWDQSYNGFLAGILPGTPDVVIRLPKCP